jgi:ATP-dependent protease HslVU (ClpYQ) peptidase subunit
MDCLIVLNGLHPFIVEETIVSEINNVSTIGSGGGFALGTWFYNKDAIKAVETASKYDNGTGAGYDYCCWLDGKITDEIEVQL